MEMLQLTLANMRVKLRQVGHSQGDSREAKAEDLDEGSPKLPNPAVSEESSLPFSVLQYSPPEASVLMQKATLKSQGSEACELCSFVEALVQIVALRPVAI